MTSVIFHNCISPLWTLQLGSSYKFSRPWLNRRFATFLLHGATSAICFVHGALRVVLENSGCRGSVGILHEGMKPIGSYRII